MNIIRANASKSKPLSAATKISRECASLINSSTTENAAVLLGDVFATCDGLHQVARVHGENFRTHLHFSENFNQINDPDTMFKISIEDIVRSISTAPLLLTVYATRPTATSLSLKISVLPDYAPLTILVSTLSPLCKQALLNLLALPAFDVKNDDGVSASSFVHFRYPDILRAAFSPGVVITAILLHTLSSNAKVRAYQMPIFHSVLCEYASTQEYVPNRTPPELEDLCRRNVRHMQMAASIFANGNESWQWERVISQLEKMTSECKQDIVDATLKRIKPTAL